MKPSSAELRGMALKTALSIRCAVLPFVRLDEVNLARIAVAENIGIGCFMEQSVLADIKAERFVRLLDDWTPPFPGLCLYYPGRRNPSAGLKAFLALARELASSASAQKAFRGIDEPG